MVREGPFYCPPLVPRLGYWTCFGQSTIWWSLVRKYHILHVGTQSLQHILSKSVPQLQETIPLSLRPVASGWVLYRIHSPAFVCNPCFTDQTFHKYSDTGACWGPGGRKGEPILATSVYVRKWNDCLRANISWESRPLVGFAFWACCLSSSFWLPVFFLSVSQRRVWNSQWG